MTFLKRFGVELVCILILTGILLAMWHHCRAPAAAPRAPSPDGTTSAGFDWTLATQIICAVVAALPLLIPALGQFLKDLAGLNYAAATKDAEEIDRVVATIPVPPVQQAAAKAIEKGPGGT